MAVYLSKKQNNMNLMNLYFSVRMRTFTFNLAQLPTSGFLYIESASTPPQRLVGCEGYEWTDSRQLNQLNGVLLVLFDMLIVFSVRMARWWDEWGESNETLTVQH